MLCQKNEPGGHGYSPIQNAGGTPKNISEQRTIPRNIKTSSSVGLGLSATLWGCTDSQGLN
jgi:hypothetical protein